LEGKKAVFVMNDFFFIFVAVDVVVSVIQSKYLLLVKKSIHLDLAACKKIEYLSISQEASMKINRPSEKKCATEKI